MRKQFLFVVSLSFVVACSSDPKKPISANTTQEVQKMEAEIQAGYTAQYDVLAAKDFNNALKHLSKAKKSLTDNEEEDVLREIQSAHDFYQGAAAHAQERSQPAERLTTARGKALTAGARGFDDTKAELKRLDDQLRDNIKEIEKMEPPEFAELQRGYLKIELQAIENTQLGDAKKALTAALAGGARSATPKALRQAEFDLKNAQNQIATNRNYPERFAPAVSKSLESADLLGAILTTATGNGQRLDEKTATQIVLQNRQIGSLEGRMKDKDTQTQKERQEMQEQANQKQQDLLKQQQELQQQLKEQKNALNQASSAVALQNSIEQARQSFSEEEADVFQQGGKLLIRLKTMNFPSGRSDLPAEALPVLAKVKAVAQGLGPDAVIVEGHTDSVGDPALNEKLSQKRADAVAQYLATTGIDAKKIQSVGYGFKKPISSNRTPVGRSQNRRVDVVITPKKDAGSAVAGDSNSAPISASARAPASASAPAGH
jgi:outer membrane protein OmpA-like peptidoglycan-associated protein